MYKAFIVEDEQPARQRLLKMLTEYESHVTVLGEADRGVSAVEQIETLRPQVLFLDIQLPDMTGFEILNRLTYQPLIIFTTAYAEYAIEAFEAYAIDYLVKPFDAARFNKAIQKLIKLGPDQKNVNYSKLETLFNHQKNRESYDSLPVKTGDRILLLDYDDIVYIKAEDKYVTIYMEDGKSHLCEKSLGKLEAVLPESFIRVHRSFIIHRSFIAEVRKYFKGKIILQMKDIESTKITTSEKYSNQVKEVLGLK